MVRLESTNRAAVYTSHLRKGILHVDSQRTTRSSEGRRFARANPARLERGVHSTAAERQAEGSGVLDRPDRRREIEEARYGPPQVHGELDGPGYVLPRRE